MIGVEIINPDRRDANGRPLADAVLAKSLQASCLAHGLIVELGGRHGAVIRLLPPLIVTLAQVTQVCEILAAVLAHCSVKTCHV